MSDFLLATKIFAPPLTTRRVSRRHLLEQLNAGMQPGRRLILISAPAGFGKSTLVAEWIETLKVLNTETPSQKFAWLSLDVEDNDPLRFLSYLIASIEAAQIGLSEEVLAQIKAAPMLSPKTVLAGLINPLAGLPGCLTLVLEDYHVITELAIHEGLIYFLEHLPSNLRLVLTTRADPPFPLARLRARQQMVELRGADLRFDLVETQTFMSQVMGLNLPLAELENLENHTEGWITGLQLAAISMQGQEDTKRFIAAFTGSHRYIFDYLVEEVLRIQPPDIQAFLIQTSVLERMNGPLCDALLTQPQFRLEPSQAVLQRLEQGNLFIIALDNQRQWYRYHHLFADFLQSRLLSSDPDLFIRLNQRAAEWFEAQGLMSDAIHHALESAKTGQVGFDLVVRLVEKAAPGALERGEINQLQNWLKALPENIINTRPILSIYATWLTLTIAGPVKQVEAKIGHLNQLLNSTEDPEHKSMLQNHIQVLQLFGNINHRNPFKAFAHGQQVLSQLPRDDPFLQKIVLMVLEMGARLTGGVLEHLLPASMDVGDLSLSSSSSNTLVAQILAISRGIELKLKGHLYQAEKQFRLSLLMAEALSQTQTIFPIVANLGLGDLLYERNDLETAQRYLQKFLLSEPGLEIPELFVDCYLGLSRIHQAQGDWKAVEQDLSQLHYVLDVFDLSWFNRVVEIHEIRLCLRQNKLQDVQSWVNKQPALGDESFLKDPRAFQLMVLEKNIQARLALALGRFDETEKIERELLQSNITQFGVNWEIETYTLLALALAGQRRTPEALDALNLALIKAEQNGFVRILLDEGEPMAALLKLAYQNLPEGRAKKYAQTLYGLAQPLSQETENRRPAQPSMLDPLSEREIEVLHLIAAGFSNKLIAERLYLAESTVKTHLKHIYSKLAVESRTQAVSRARELKLIVS
jgi:LuxR family maltose regulon positive regulatory protein